MSETSRPFTIRFSERELALIRQYAPDEPVGRTVRRCALQVILNKKPTPESLPRPSKIEVAGFLGTLGISNIAQVLAGVRMALEVAGLETEHPVFGQIARASDDIHELKAICVHYLGVRPPRR